MFCFCLKSNNFYSILQQFQNYPTQSNCDSNSNVQECLSIFYKSTLQKNLRKTTKWDTQRMEKSLFMKKSLFLKKAIVNGFVRFLVYCKKTSVCCYVLNHTLLMMNKYFPTKNSHEYKENKRERIKPIL